MRSEEVIREQMESAKETADDLDENGSPLDALMAMAVYRTLKWVDGQGAEKLDDELMKIDREE